MDANQWARTRSLFHSLVSLPRDEQLRKLASLPENDRDLRAELEKLLTESESLTGFLSTGLALESASPAVRTLTPGEIVGERYQVEQFLGAGGMGEVYRVHDREANQAVALKTLRADATSQPMLISRLHKELQLARRIVHPNVCRMFEIGRATRPSGEIVYLTMELLAGPTLSETIRERPMTIAEATPIASQLISGLDAAHAEGILHRDFKSANVILVGDRAIITDFGLARERGAEETFSDFRTGAIIGTPAYMPPEQLQGKTLTTAADIHALGAVLFEMVTGRVPFPGGTPLATALKRLQHDAPSPRELVDSIPSAWEGAILACLEKDPARRPAAALDVLALLEGRTRRSFRLPTRRIAAGALVAGAAGAAIYAGSRRTTFNVEAERSFKKAEEYARRRTATDLRNAVEEYEKAIKLEPQHARAWAGLANVFSAMSEFGMIGAEEGYRKASDAAQRAIKLDPHSARGHGAIGYLISNDLNRWHTAAPSFERAVGYDPKDPLVRLWYASFLGKRGDSAAALGHIAKGLNEDPSNFVLNQQLAFELYRARRYDECYRQTLELVRLQPFEGGTHFMMARVLERQAKYDEALARCDEAVKYALMPALADSMRAVIHWSQADATGARQLALAAGKYWERKPMATIHIATAYGYMGEHEKAIGILLTGCDRNDASVLGAQHHPLLDGMRAHPRYSQFLSRVGGS